jgi:hypothetical protein
MQSGTKLPNDPAKFEVSHVQAEVGKGGRVAAERPN